MNSALTGQAMSTASTSAWSASAIWQHINDAATKVLEFAKELDADWTTVKANPIYGQLVTLGAQMATKTLAADGVPVGPLVNVGAALETTLEAMAVAHPAIVTAPVAGSAQPSSDRMWAVMGLPSAASKLQGAAS